MEEVIGGTCIPTTPLPTSRFEGFQGFIELFAPGGSKAKLHSHTTFLMNEYLSSTNK